VKEIRAKKDFYKILGIERDATEDQIKKAYRKVSQTLEVPVDFNRLSLFSWL